MLSIKSLGSADSDLAAYYESLARDDYYYAGGEPPGRWHGRLAVHLDLFGNVKSGQLAKAFRGRHPLTEQDLAGNAGDGHKAGWDLTFSAPKSVSLMWAVSGQEHQTKIAQAHDQAVARALEYLEKRAFSSRDRRDPHSGRGSILAAVYQHGTSRELDPQLHSHAVVANLGKRIDGSWCALDFDSRWKMAAGAIYRAELASRLQQIGYGIERDGSSFGIVGIDKKMTEAFSTRRRQIVEALKQTGFTGAKAASVAALHTRQVKQDVDRQTLMPIWRDQAAAVGLDAAKLSSLHRNPHLPTSTSSVVINDILKSLTQTASTFTRMQLEASAATEAQGQLNADGIEALVDTEIKNRQKDLNPLGLVKLRVPMADSRREHSVERYTTNEMLAIERAIVTGAVGRKSETRHQVSAGPGLISHPSLSLEQIQALKHVTEGEGAVSMIQGLAGTGKSMLLAAAKDSWQAGGLNVIGAALAGKAADSLEQGSCIRSQTLHSLIGDIDDGRRQLTERDVLVIDEAGTVGSRQLKHILDRAHAAGAKVVLVGDAKQLQSIEAGGMFRYLADSMGYAELKDIRRQEKVADREMIGALIDGNAHEVLADLTLRGMLTTEPGMNLHEIMVNSWSDHYDFMNPKATIMLAGTRSDVYRLNVLAREKIQEANRLHSETKVETDRGPREFAIGERMMFTRNSRQFGVKNGQTGTLEGWSVNGEGSITYTIACDDGNRVIVNSDQYRYLEYGYALSVHKAQGQTVDNVFLLMSDTMANREWSYVAASRHRKELRVFVAEEQAAVIEAQMERSRQKVTATEFSRMNVEDEEDTCLEMV
ncbi:MAG: MobF family relaxase [Sterolibacterium sp.]